MSVLTHLNAAGEAHMVDVGGKAVTSRAASAEGFVSMSESALDALLAGDLKKGDALAVARIAGIAGAKKTADLIPLCHPLALTGVVVEILPERKPSGVRVRASVKTAGVTGVEMEALCAVSIACLALYDMVKAADRAMEIGPVRLLTKSGGRSGDWIAPPKAP